MMDALGVAGDLGADDARRVALVRRAVHAADALAVDHLDVERANRRAIVRTDRGTPDDFLRAGDQRVHGGTMPDPAAEDNPRPGLGWNRDKLFGDAGESKDVAEAHRCVPGASFEALAPRGRLRMRSEDVRSRELSRRPAISAARSGGGGLALVLVTLVALGVSRDGGRHQARAALRIEDGADLPTPSRDIRRRLTSPTLDAPAPTTMSDNRNGRTMTASSRLSSLASMRRLSAASPGKRGYSTPPM